MYCLVLYFRSGFEFEYWLNDSAWPPYVPDLSAGEPLMKPAEELALKLINNTEDGNVRYFIGTGVGCTIRCSLLQFCFLTLCTSGL